MYAVVRFGTGHTVLGHLIGHTQMDRNRATQMDRYRVTQMGVIGHTDLGSM